VPLDEKRSEFQTCLKGFNQVTTPVYELKQCAGQNTFASQIFPYREGRNQNQNQFCCRKMKMQRLSATNCSKRSRIKHQNKVCLQSHQTRKEIGSPPSEKGICLRYSRTIINAHLKISQKEPQMLDFALIDGIQ
jgi:hypothetical protein